MEIEGVTSKLVRFNLDQNFCDEINKTYKTNHTLQDFQQAADKCIAQEWLIHTTLGRGYDHIGITTSGVGVVRSRNRVEELKKSRTWIKKLSDNIEEHKGIIGLITIAIAIITIAIKILKGE